MNQDTKSKLSVVTITFHWLVALMFIGLITVGLIMDNMPRGPEKFQLMGIHKSIGTIFLLVAVARIVYRIKQGFPEDLSEKPRWQHLIATSVHHILLLATVLMPLSGIMMSIGGGRGLDVFGLELIGSGDKIEWMAAIGSGFHGVAAKVMIAIIVLHTAAAIKQQFVDKTLSRMLGKTI